MSVTKAFSQHFIKVPNKIITDPEISGEACKIYCYLLIKPDNWEIDYNEIKDNLRIKNHKTVEKCLKQLLNKKWLFKDAKKDEYIILKF